MRKITKEQIHFSKFLYINCQRYNFIIRDFNKSKLNQDNDIIIADFNYNKDIYYIFMTESQEEYSFDNKSKSKRKILDIVAYGEYIIHIPKLSFNNALQQCQRKPDELSDNILIEFERINKDYFKIWSVKNV